MRPKMRGLDAYSAVTRGVRVSVSPTYAPDQSDPDMGRYFWAYSVRIENVGEQTVQLIARHWIITDALNRTEEVRGPGVVGEQPILGPGESFEYTSGCPLATSSGVMVGDYAMRTDAGEVFEAAVPAFSLHLPGATQSLN